MFEMKNKPKRFGASYYKKAFEDLHQKMQEDKVSYEANIKRIETSYEEKKKEFAKSVTDLMEAFPSCYAHQSFSEGFLSENLRYKVMVSRPLKAGEIDILIKKLEFDNQVLFHKSNE